MLGGSDRWAGLIVSRRVVLAMSGGVDSSASAVLLQQQGFEVIGLFMRSGATEAEVCRNDSGNLLPLLTTPSHKQGCCSASDAADAQRVADLLDIPFHALNFQDGFGRIKDYFADEYLAGRTPNPCVQCNNWLKLGKLWDFAQQIGADWIATGHYAQIANRESPSGARLIRGVDPGKDQSYVLAGIRRELLPRILFPVGSFQKSEIRDLAALAGLRNAAKPDSQEICFIPDNDYAGFLERYRGKQDTAGEFVDAAGNVLGHHDGYERFTIGQRRGLGVTFGEPRFVIRIEPETHRVVLGAYEELRCRELIATQLNWLVDLPPGPLRCYAQIRYQHRASLATVVTGDPTREDANGEWLVTFDASQYGVAPGQAVVLYSAEDPENQVLGGGWIRSSRRGS